MSENWTAIAAEVDQALRSVADISQPNGYPATIRRAGARTGGPDYAPVFGPPTYTTVRVVVFDKELRDINGTLIGQTKRTITISGAAGIVPTDDDTIAEGIEAAQASESSAWQEIVMVMPLAPTGIAVLYELEVAT